MNGWSVVREARKRAGLTQAELARRMGTTQSAVARMEAGTTAPSLSKVGEAVAACGLALDVGLTTLDPDEWERARRNLRLSPDRRARNLLAASRFVLAGRAARTKGAGHRR